MTVTVVIEGSNEVIFKSGVSVRPSSVVGFSTTWELVWEPSGGVEALRSGVMASPSSWEPDWVQLGGGALVSVNMVIGGSPEVWEPSGGEAALVSVNIVTVGSLEAVLRSGATAGP